MMKPFKLLTAALVFAVATAMGASAESPASTLGDISVKDFGATGDGKTDDSAAIQNAINSLGTTGGTVVFPVGTYLVTKTLEVPNTITLLGKGADSRYEARDGSILLQGSEAMTSLLHVTGKDVTIAKLGIRGDQVSPTDGIHSERADYLTLQDNMITNFGGRGIYTDSAVVQRIVNNTLYANKGNSIEGSLWDSYVAGNDVAYGQNGLYVSGGPTRIEGNKFWLSAGQGIWLAGQHSIVTGNDIQYPGQTGIYVASTENIINGNLIQCPGQTATEKWFKSAIYVRSSNNQIVNNRLSNTTVEKYETNSAEYGIHVTGGLSELIITGNSMLGVKTKGINLAPDLKNYVETANLSSTLSSN